MKIRLADNAPWNEVKIQDKIINKTQWIEESEVFYLPVKKWIIFEDIVEETVDSSTVFDPQPIVEADVHVMPSEEYKSDVLVQPEEEKIDYSKLTKTELIKICEEKQIETEGKTKTQLIEILTNLN